VINQQIQNYKIISLIGEGGMGDVYLAEHVSIQRKVAIKVLKPELVKNEEIRLRFKNEAAMLAHLQHPNIVGLIDYVEQDGGLFLIMEYVEGQGLDDLIKAQQAPISIERAKKLMIQIVEAFIYAHKNGIVHRDVKPSNILVTNDDQIKVLDFGIAKLVGEGNHHLTKTGTQIGTVYYMSPEQVRGKVLDHRSDIYSLGVTFYELLTGVCPYKSMTTEYEIYDNIVKEPLLDLTQTMGSDYRSMWNIISKATEKDVNDRYQNCDIMVNVLKTNEPIKNPIPLTENIKLNEPNEKKNYSLKLVLILSVLILIISGYFLFDNDKSKNMEQNAKTETVKAIVLIDEINFRASNSTSSSSLSKIPFGTEIELIGDPIGPTKDKEFEILWQKANWNGTEGWLGIEVDNQKTVGNQEEADDVSKLIGGAFNKDAEYAQMRLWAHHNVRNFIRSRNEVGKYSFKVISKALHRDGYRSVIRYHFNDNYRKNDPYDFLVFLNSTDGRNIAVFCKANLDGKGGKIDGWCELPQGASHFSFTKEESRYSGDFEIGEVIIHDQFGNILGYLDDKSHHVYDNSIYEIYGC
jgi:serine/threonine protein kinase